MCWDARTYGPHSICFCVGFRVNTQVVGSNLNTENYGMYTIIVASPEILKDGTMLNPATHIDYIHWAIHFFKTRRV